MIGRMTDSKHILIRLVLLILLTGQLTSCHANSMLFKKLRSIPSLLGKRQIFFLNKRFKLNFVWIE